MPDKKCKSYTNIEVKHSEWINSKLHIATIKGKMILGKSNIGEEL